MNVIDPFVHLDEAVERFFAGQAAAWATAPGVVAFSGGADSTALAVVLARRARERGLPLVAAHLDHGLDPASSSRAAAAAAAARRLGLPFVTCRRPPVPEHRRRDGSEAAARQSRYQFLAEVAARHRAAWVATAHHRDDQAETVLLRLLFGTGLTGLSGIRAVAGLTPGVVLLRPLLEVARSEIVAMLGGAGIGWADDPTNDDPAVPRNRVRHLLLPRLAAREATDPQVLAASLATLAGVAGGAERSLSRRLADRLDLRPAGERPEAAATPGGTFEAALGAGPRGTATVAAASLDLAAVDALPVELLPPALAILHRACGLPYPPSAAAVRELRRQLSRRRSIAAPGRGSGHHAPVACDAGSGWRWRDVAGRLTLLHAEADEGGRMAPFSYTLTVPGELEVAELGLRFRLTQRAPAGWMFEGSRERAGLSLPLVPGDRVVLRNRRRGDRLRPLGAAGTRHLKELLIDHRVPYRRRDRIALLCLGSEGTEIVWVPGVTIEHRYRLRSGTETGPVWVAEILPSISTTGPDQPRKPGESVDRSNRW